jgi:hypothetical protein
MAITHTPGYTFSASELLTPAKLNAAQTALVINMATARFLGRTTGGDGAVEELDAAAMRTGLGLVIGTNVQAYNANLTTYAGIAPSANVQSMLGAADYAAIRTLLGLVIGTNVQAYNANLTTYAGIAPSANVQNVLSAADYAAMRALFLPSYLESVDGSTHGWGIFGSGGVLRTARATAAAADHHIFYNTNGNVGAIQTSGSGTLYNTSSDRRLKRLIRPAPECGGLLDRVKVREYEFKAQPGRKVRGVIAQELVRVFPEAVSRGDRARRGKIRRQWMVDYSKLVPALVQEVQSLRRRLAKIESANKHHASRA